jgi:hypothetical protein
LKKAARLRQLYHDKCREADEAEDDARFAPLPPSVQHSPATSERHSYAEGEAAAKPEPAVFNLSRTFTKRVAGARSVQALERLKKLAKEKAEAAAGKLIDGEELVQSPDGDATPTRLSWAEKGKEVQRNSQDDVVGVGIAGLQKSPLEWSQVFLRARDALPKRRSVDYGLGTGLVAS